MRVVNSIHVDMNLDDEYIQQDFPVDTILSKQAFIQTRDYVNETLTRTIEAQRDTDSSERKRSVQEVVEMDSSSEEGQE